MNNSAFESANELRSASKERYEELVYYRSSAIQCCCDDGNSWAIELWADEFGDEYDNLKKYFEKDN